MVTENIRPDQAGHRVFTKKRGFELPCYVMPGVRKATVPLHHTPHHPSREKLEMPPKGIFYTVKISHDHVSTKGPVDSIFR